MHDSTVRKRKLRSKRRQAGMKALELWLPPDTAALVEHVKRPDESFSELVGRALHALAQDAQGGHAGETLSYDARKPAVLARLWAMQAEGLSHQEMANRLNAEGVPTLSGRGQWQAGTIGKMLKQYPRHGA
jgi:hypothetical protein